MQQKKRKSPQATPAPAEHTPASEITRSFISLFGEKPINDLATPTNRRIVVNWSRIDQKLVRQLEAAIVNQWRELLPVMRTKLRACEHEVRRLEIMLEQDSGNQTVYCPATPTIGTLANFSKSQRRNLIDSYRISFENMHYPKGIIDHFIHELEVEWGLQ